MSHHIEDQKTRSEFLREADQVVKEFAAAMQRVATMTDADSRYVYIRGYGVNLAALGLFVREASIVEMENALYCEDGIMSWVLFWYTHAECDRCNKRFERTALQKTIIYELDGAGEYMTSDGWACEPCVKVFEKLELTLF